MNLAQLLNPDHGRAVQPEDENGDGWYWIPFMSAAPERMPLYRPNCEELWLRLNEPNILDRSDDDDEPF